MPLFAGKTKTKNLCIKLISRELYGQKTGSYSTYESLEYCLRQRELFGCHVCLGKCQKIVISLNENLGRRKNSVRIMFLILEARPMERLFPWNTRPDESEPLDLSIKCCADALVEAAQRTPVGEIFMGFCRRTHKWNFKNTGSFPANYPVTVKTLVFWPRKLRKIP